MPWTTNGFRANWQLIQNEAIPNDVVILSPIKVTHVVQVDSATPEKLGSIEIVVRQNWPLSTLGLNSLCVTLEHPEWELVNPWNLISIPSTPWLWREPPDKRNWRIRYHIRAYLRTISVLSRVLLSCGFLQPACTIPFANGVLSCQGEERLRGSVAVLYVSHIGI